MCVEDHLQGLTGIGDAEQFAAVAQPELGDLYLGRHTAQLDLLITPVELEGITGIIFKRDEGFCRSLAFLFPPGADVTADSVIATGIPLTLQLLEQDLRTAAMLDRFGFVFL
jgi:hypothetical protein